MAQHIHKPAARRDSSAKGGSSKSRGDSPRGRVNVPLGPGASGKNADEAREVTRRKRQSDVQ